MPIKYSYTTLRPKDGGQLATRPSYESTSFNNYVVKENWRRDLDQEIRREGWLYFQPNKETLGSQHLNAGAPVTLLHMVRQPNGRTAVSGESFRVLSRLPRLCRTSAIGFDLLSAPPQW